MVTAQVVRERMAGHEGHVANAYVSVSRLAASKSETNFISKNLWWF